MKNILKIGLLTLPLLITGQACQEPDQEVFSSIPQDEVINSTDPDVLAVLAASAYSQLAGTWGAHNSLWSMHEISSDEMAITQKGADWEDGGQWIRMHRHQWLPTEESINNGWNYVYNNIGNVNNLLKDFGDNEILNSELSVLRALMYYWLLDAYGNVPIIEEDDTNPTPVNNSRQEVFDFIESEVIAALPNLQEEATYATINYYVAQTLLAKLYLNAEVYTGTARWADAAAAAQEVIDGGKYSLEVDFFANFAEQNQGSSENIFVINYDKDNAQGFNLAQMTLHYLSQETYRLQEQPWNGYSSLEEFYNSFDEDDDRIGSFLVGPQFSATGDPLIDISREATDPEPQLVFTPEINMLAPNALRQAGARVGKFEFANGSPNSLSNDFPIFRYSDVLLMRAEALWRMNPGDAEALDLVNQVRARAGLTDPVASLNADFLLAERGREMFAEGWRRQDMIRFGEFLGTWWEKPASTDIRLLFPLPQAAIDANTNLTQNSGY